MDGRLNVFSGKSNPALALDVCARLATTPGKALVSRFSDGEVRVEIQENVRGMDAFIIQSTCPPVNEHLMEILVIADALKRASARRINIVLPYFGYGRQDKKQGARASLGARMVADMLTTSGADRVVTFNFHAGQIQGFFDIPVDHLTGEDILLATAKTGLRGDEVVVAPDAGRVKVAERYAQHLGCELALVHKTRPRGTAPRSNSSSTSRFRSAWMMQWTARTQ